MWWIIWGFLGFVWGHAATLTTPAQEFLWDRHAKPFQQQYGQEKASLGAVFYVSLSCFHCRDLLNSFIRPLIESPEVKSGALWVGLRDFPSDHLGFWASVFCWQQRNGQTEAFNKAMDQTSWLEDGKPLEALAKILGRSFAQLTQNTKKNTELKSKLMTLAQKEQKILNIRQVPIVFLVSEKSYQAITDVRVAHVKKALHSWIESHKNASTIENKNVT